MINALDRKLLRDLWNIKGQVLAIVLVMAAGVATFVMSLNTQLSLMETQETYYERYRFGHVFASMKRAPLSLERRLALIPGVTDVAPRVMRDVTLDVPGLVEPAIGRLISIPDRGQPRLARLHLRSGTWPEPGAANQVLVGEAFATAHGFEAGDRLTAILNGRKKQLEITGVALAPDFIYSIRAGDAFPDDKRFGVLWMCYTPLAAAFDMEGAFNDVSVALTPEANEAEVIKRLDEITEVYGGLGAYGRRDQVSNRFVSDEIASLRGVSRTAPAIFLSVAAFLLNVVLARTISLQREQIGTLKAFGYTASDIGWHYWKMVLLIVAASSVLGTWMGALLGADMVNTYNKLYRFPNLYFHLNSHVVVLAVGVAAAAGLLGTLTAVRHAVVLPPAVAMRSEPPGDYRPTLFERLGWTNWLTQPERMILRHLERRPLKAALTVLGIAMSVAVLVLGSFGIDAIDYVMDVQFHLAQRQDLSITFVEPRPYRAVHEIEHLRGVSHTEAFRAVPVRLRFEHRSRRQAIIGVPPTTTLQRLLDEKLRPVPLPPEGLVLSAKLAELLECAAGDELTVEVLEGKRPVRRVGVVSLVTEFIGSSAYMNLEALNRLVDEGSSVSGTYVSVDSRQAENVYRQLKETPLVASVVAKQVSLNSFRELIAENLLRMMAINFIFSTIIAFGVVYNSAQISLSERNRELASLRVLGLTRGEISYILLGELAVLTLAAIPFGLVLGHFFAWLLSLTLDTELYRIPLMLKPSTYARAALIVLGAATASGLVVRRKLDHLDLVAVLKMRE